MSCDDDTASVYAQWAVLCSSRGVAIDVAAFVASLSILL